MTAIILLLVIILLSMLFTRVAAVALTFTGMSVDMARFQARSAFSTVGFTTTEAETVVNHPVRRRIISLLMLLGNAGLVSIIATSLASFQDMNQNPEYPLVSRIAILVAGLGGLWALALSKTVDNFIFRVVGWALSRFTDLQVYDYTNLLQLGEGYNVAEMEVEGGDWLVGQRLDQLRLSNVGVNVLCIRRADEEFVGTPVGATYIRKGDRIVVYGAREAVQGLEENKGDPVYAERHRQLIIEVQAQRDAKGGGRGEDYCVSHIAIGAEDWLVDRTLLELRLGDLGINVLGIERGDGGFVGAPVGSTEVRAGDRLVVYGDRDNIVALEAGRHDPKEAERQRARMGGVRDYRKGDRGEEDAAPEQEPE